MKIATLLQDSPRTNAAVVADVQAAAQRLSIATRSWSTVEPTRAAIDETIATAHGLQRALAELHGRTAPERSSP